MNAFSDMPKQLRNDPGDDCPGPLPEEAYPEFTRAPNRTRVNHLKAALRPVGAIEPVLASRYLVKGWIDRGALSVLYGESNVGKTFLALDLALHVAAGRDWRGNRVAELPGPVVYVAAEGGRGIRNRIEAARRCDPELVEAANFYLLPMTLDLSQPGEPEALVAALADLPSPPSLVVIDTLARSMGAGDENSAKDMGRTIRALDHLRSETGAHVMLVHHSGKDSTKGARGSSALRGAVDTEIELTRDNDVMTAEPKKQRDMPLGPSFTYRLSDVELGVDEDGDPVNSAVIEPTEPVAKRPKLTGRQGIAMQALSDALAHHGEKKMGDMFPPNRSVVPLERWREYCRRHKLTEGNGESSFRKAFSKVRKSLHENEIIRIVDDYVWRVLE